MDGDTWSGYVAARTEWLAQRATQPGAFAESPAETSWNLSRSIPLPTLGTIPILVLPLRIHLASGPEFGCSLTEDEVNFHVVPMMNEYWAQAGIEWTLECVRAMEWPADPDGTRSSLADARNGIWNLRRDPSTGKMAGKDVRRELFLGCLLRGFREAVDAYDVHVFDFIGEESQGDTIRITGSQHYFSLAF
jgi:hypothetical protein